MRISAGAGLVLLALALVFSPAKNVAARPLPQQPSDDVARLTADCEQKKYAACLILAPLYESGSLVRKDLGRAAALYERACEGGEPVGCRFLAELYQGGKGVQKDEAKAAALYQRACDGGVGDACSRLGVMYLRGWGGLTKDESKAAALFQRACDLKSPLGCRNLGYAYHKGLGVPKDKDKAFDLNVQACKLAKSTGIDVQSACTPYK